MINNHYSKVRVGLDFRGTFCLNIYSKFNQKFDFLTYWRTFKAIQWNKLGIIRRLISAIPITIAEKALSNRFNFLRRGLYLQWFHWEFQSSNTLKLYSLDFFRGGSCSETSFVWRFFPHSINFTCISSGSFSQATSSSSIFKFSSTLSFPPPSLSTIDGIFRLLSWG